MKKNLIKLILFTVVFTFSFAVMSTVAMAEENQAEAKVLNYPYTVTKVSVDSLLQNDINLPGDELGLKSRILKEVLSILLEDRNDLYQTSVDRTPMVSEAITNKAIAPTIQVSRGSYTARGVYNDRGEVDFAAVSDILNQEIIDSQILGEDITNYSQSFLGKAYRYGATGPNAYDCSGFVYKVYGDFGIAVPRSSSGYLNTGVSVSLADARAGDIICFSRNGKTLSHVGIYMGEGKFIHSATSSGIIITSTSDKYWAPKIHSIKRIV